jgi:hypothetical protein
VAGSTVAASQHQASWMNRRGETIMSIRWQDYTAILLGAWLAISPWQMEFTLNHAAMGNACGVGMMLVLFNLMSAARLMEQGQEIVNIFAGFWLILSPYALAFSGSLGLTLDAMGVGIAIVCLAFWQMFDAVRTTRKEVSQTSER